MHDIRSIGRALLFFLFVNIGALRIGITFWGPLCYNYNKEPPKCRGNYYGPYITPVLTAALVTAAPSTPPVSTRGIASSSDKAAGHRGSCFCSAYSGQLL